MKKITEDFFKILKESEKATRRSNIDTWWENNYKRAINYVEKENPEILVDEFYGGDWDMFNQETGKHIAIDILYQLGPSGFEERLKEFEEEIDNEDK